MGGARIVNRRLTEASARRVTTLAVATAGSAVFAVISYEPLRLVTVSAQVAAVLVVAALLAGLAARRRGTMVVMAVGAVLTVLGVFRLLSYGHGSLGIGGAASTAALLTGLGLAYLGVAYRDRFEQS